MSTVGTIPDAVGILIQAARIGQEHGIYSLEEARVIADSIDLILTPADETKTNSISSAEPATHYADLNYDKEEDNEDIIGDDNQKPVIRYVDNTIPKKPTVADLVVKNKTSSTTGIKN